MTYDQVIVFNTTSSGCGVQLEVGEEYLIGLHRTGHNSLTTSICDLLRDWSSVSDEDKASLEAGCNDDPCDEACGEYQVRVNGERNTERLLGIASSSKMVQLVGVMTRSVAFLTLVRAEAVPEVTVLEHSDVARQKVTLSAETV